jgi:hypothetical protein
MRLYKMTNLLICTIAMVICNYIFLAHLQFIKRFMVFHNNKQLLSFD